ncbi:hypothetical protein MHU86_5270 [Fragilaria crotonensis]|nr:hypothetical protein MHU86_5270 [Fragilaria crotonensis]
MTDEKIKSHFQFHEKWARSLKAITMSPQVNHLDQQRTEYNEDGTTVERSTREWMSTILAPDKASPALCDVVNGLPDHKAYLLVPSHYHAFVQQAWRNYKSRLYPPNHREARFRDTLPGLPDVIHIQAEIKSQVSFLEQLSGASVWQQDGLPADHQEVTTGSLHNEDQPPNDHQSLARRSAWPTPAEGIRQSTSRNRKESSKSRSHQHHNDAFQSTGGGTSLGSDDDRSTASTRSLTNGSRFSTPDTRFQDLEIDATKVTGVRNVRKKSSDRLLSMEHQFSRIEDLDRKVAAVNDKLDRAAVQMDESHTTQQHILNDMEGIKTQTAAQFEEINQRLLSNMESQHKMSTTMLDLREHFEKMSNFLENLATKMEVDRKNAVDTTMQVNYARAASSATRDLKFHDSQSTSSASTGSSKSKASVQSNASSSVYCSPEEKTAIPT